MWELGKIKYSEKSKCIISRPMKIFISLSFFLITISLLLVVSTPSNGTYEFSIYSAMPWFFWVMLTLSMVIGLLVILSQFNTKYNKIICLGLLIILLSNSILLLLPIFRGYVIYGREDVLTHIGWMKDILQTGSIPNMFYPLAHILGVSLLLISDIDVYKITSIIPAFFSLFFIISTYILAKQILNSRKQILFAMMVGSMLLFGNFHLAFTPFSQSFFLVPISLYSLLKSYSSSYSLQFRILFFILLIPVALYHPLGSMLFIAILLIIYISDYLFRRKQHVNVEGFPSIYGLQNLKNIIGISIVIYLSWQAYLILLKNQVEGFIRNLGSASDISELAININLITSNHLSFMDIFYQFTYLYGQLILLLLPTSIGILILLNGRRRENYHISRVMLILISIFTLFILASFFGIVSPIAFGFRRYLYYSVYASVFLLPLLLFTDHIHLSKIGKIFNKNQNVFISLFLISLLVTSIVNLYPSPTIRSVNNQVTESELTGMNYFFNSCNDSSDIFELGISQFRFHDVLYGLNSPRIGVSWGYPLPPDHFSYGSNISWMGNHTNSKYLLICDAGKNYYHNIYPDFPDEWRFLNEDFHRLSLDTNVSEIYRNGNLEVYNIE